ncbi:MAG TPA: isochorismatase family protein [Vicinamibacterales bacterium]|nr:isochorismatase family protein [Vicinamibacterales bacterium]
MGARDHSHEALLVVDVQRDFCAGGALEAPNADAILPALNRHIAEARAKGATIYASRDWHPRQTTHFKEFGGEWPPHCVENTDGAQFHPDLQLPAETIVISKGDDPARPGYSAFDGKTDQGRLLLDDLRARGITKVTVAGLCTDYCVKATTLDALGGGLDATVLTDAIAAINVRPGDAERALAEMAAAGATIVR